MDIFTANLELYCDNGHYISYLPRTVYLSYILGVPIIGKTSINDLPKIFIPFCENSFAMHWEKCAISKPLISLERNQMRKIWRVGIPNYLSTLICLINEGSRLFYPFCTLSTFVDFTPPPRLFPPPRLLERWNYPKLVHE